MHALVDDVGSFPLPSHIDRSLFEKARGLAKEATINGEDLRKNQFLADNFVKVVADSFRKKRATGLDVINYPQHCDMHRQFVDAVHSAMDEGTYLVDERQAIIPEIHVINNEAKRLYEESRTKVSLRVCVTGPMELYLKEIGTTPYMDILLMFAETVRRFARNSILNSKYVATVAVSIDEPSLGFQDVSTDRDAFLSIMEKAFDINGVTAQIHLHSSARISDLLRVERLDVLSFEYAASPRNIEGLSKSELDKADKQVRVGIARTDIDSIMAELFERGVKIPSAEQLVESETVMRKRFETARKKYGDRMTFTGPDCGLGGWPTQEAAQLLLKRAVRAARGDVSESG